MASFENSRRARSRQASGSISDNRFRRSAAWFAKSSTSTIQPVTPSSTTSGTDPPAPSLLRRGPPQEQDEVLLPLLERVQAHIDAVVDDPPVAQVLVEPLLRLADRHEPDPLGHERVQAFHLGHE